MHANGIPTAMAESAISLLEASMAIAPEETKRIQSQSRIPSI